VLRVAQRGVRQRDSDFPKGALRTRQSGTFPRIAIRDSILSGSESSMTTFGAPCTDKSGYCACNFRDRIDSERGRAGKQWQAGGQRRADERVEVCQGRLEAEESNSSGGRAAPRSCPRSLFAILTRCDAPRPFGNSSIPPLFPIASGTSRGAKRPSMSRSRE